MYIAGVCWTLVYDTIYAHQDTRDDAALGLKSTALLFGEEGSQRWLAGFSAVTLTALCVAGMAAGQAWPYYTSVAAAGAHMAWQVGTLDARDGPGCGRRFAANRDLGLILFVGIVLGTLLTSREEGEVVNAAVAGA